MKKWNVPFITRRTDIWQVEAKNASEATMKAVLMRERYLQVPKGVDDSPDRPTHTHEDHSIGSTSGVAEDPAAEIEPDLDA